MNPRTVLVRSGLPRMALFAAAVWPILAAGCIQGDRQPPAAAMSHPVLEGIPLPNHFALVDDQSMARVSGRMRIARVKFVGPTERVKVARFFEERMPLAGFELRQTGFDGGMYQMRFESSNEECTLRVLPEKRKTAIYVEVGPLALEPAGRPPADPAGVPPPTASDPGMP